MEIIIQVHEIYIIYISFFTRTNLRCRGLAFLDRRLFLAFGVRTLRRIMPLHATLVTRDRDVTRSRNRRVPGCSDCWHLVVTPCKVLARLHHLATGPEHASLILASPKNLLLLAAQLTVAEWLGARPGLVPHRLLI